MQSETDMPTHSSSVAEKAEEKSIKEAANLKPITIYETIRREGEEELLRPARSLIWSGIAAGVLISFSVLGMSVFRTYLPDSEWRYLVESLGYSLGFLLVIMGRMQLFTENTIMTVLPIIAKPSPKSFLQLGRLWGLVLGANVVGCFVAAAALVHTPMLSLDVMGSFLAVSKHAMEIPAGESFVRGIPAGLIIAAMVWMLPQARSNSFIVVVTFTWLIAVSGFTHIVAGSTEMAFMILSGNLGVGEAVFGFFVPVFFGNVIGGTVVFSFLAWAQVKPEAEQR